MSANNIVFISMVSSIFSASVTRQVVVCLKWSSLLDMLSGDEAQLRVTYKYIN